MNCFRSFRTNHFIRSCCIMQLLFGCSIKGTAFAHTRSKTKIAHLALATWIKLNLIGLEHSIHPPIFKHLTPSLATIWLAEATLGHPSSCPIGFKHVLFEVPTLTWTQLLHLIPMRHRRLSAQEPNTERIANLSCVIDIKGVMLNKFLISKQYSNSNLMGFAFTLY